MHFQNGWFGQIWLAAFLALAVPVPEARAGGCKLLDDGAIVRLENDFLRLTLRPPKGGTSLDFFYKPAKKQFIPKNEALPLFADTATEVGWRGPWVSSAYEYEVLANAPEKVSVHLEGKGSGAFPFVNMHKTITIYADRDVVQVDHAVEVDANNMVPAYISPWFHNGLAVVGEQTRYVAPVPSGLARRWDFENQNKSLNYKNITRPWSAMIGRGGSGVALELTNYRHLEMLFHAFYQQEWCFEWRFNRVKIAPGGKLKTRFWLVPFHGLSGVDGVGGRMVGFLNCPERMKKADPVAARLELFSADKRKAAVEITATRLPDGKPNALLKKTIEFMAGKLVRQPFTFSPGAPGTYVLRCRVQAEGKVVCDFEKPIVAGQASGKYSMKPAGERVPPEVMERKPMKLSHEIVTPHVKWAKPYSRGRTRALILMEIVGVRDIVELAQRMDLEYTTVKMSNGDSYLRYYGAPDSYGPATILECNDSLRTVLKKDYDVILISGIRWSRFSKDNRKKILTKAKAGTGFIYISPPEVTPELREALGIGNRKRRRPRFLKLQPDNRNFLSNSLPYPALFETPVYEYDVTAGGQATAPILAEGVPVMVTQDRPARSVALLYQPGGLLPLWQAKYQKTWPEYDKGIHYRYWEYFYGLVARCILWAGHKEPEVRILRLQAPEKIVRPGHPGSTTIRAVFVKTGAGRASYRAEFTVRDKMYEEEFMIQREFHLGQGQTQVTAELPEELRNGIHLVDLRIIDSKDKVVNWASTSFQARNRMRISKCRLDRQIYTTGESIEVEVSMEGAPRGPADCVVEVSDAFGRVLLRQRASLAIASSAPEAQARIGFALKFVPLTRWHRLDARLFRKGKLIDRTFEEFLVFPKRAARSEWDDFVMGTTCQASRLSQYWLFDRFNAQLVSLGFTKFDIWEYAFGVKAHDREVAFDLYQAGAKYLAPVCSTRFAGSQREFRAARDAAKANYKKTGNKLALVRAPCLDDPEFWKSEEQKLGPVLSAMSELRAGTYLLGDEDTLTRFGQHGDGCYGPHTLRNFRSWLQEEYYPALDALNAEWDTQFKSWEEVVPMTRVEVRGRGNYAPWADHRSYMETAWARGWRRYREIVDKHDPLAYIGCGGSQIYQADNGLDFWKFFREWEQTNARGVITWMGKLYRSLPGAPIMTQSAGIGWNRYGGQTRYWVWKGAFETRGAGDTAYPAITKVAPDLSISRSGRSAEEATRPLRHGIGKLLRKLDIAWDEVAIHYSQPSIHGEFIIGRDHTTPEAHQSWVVLLRDLGIDPKYLSYAQVEQGELSTQNFMVFIMPFSVAVSRKEVARIKAFVRQGGVVIGDAMTGVMDGHCKPWSPSPLDELFGVKRGPDPVGSSGKALILPGQLLGRMGRPALLDVPLTEDGLVAAGARAAGRLSSGKPCLLINEYGRGKAIRLGFLLSDYATVTRYSPRSRQVVLELVGTLLRQAGVTRKVRVMGKDGVALPFCETWRFRRGNAEFVGLVREWDPKVEQKEEEARIEFSRQRYVYEMVSGRYLGHEKEARLSLAPARPAFFALLEQEVKSLHVIVTPKEITAVGATPFSPVNYEITISAGGDTPQDHVFRVEVIGPDGKPRPHYAANLFAKKGKAEGSISLALNDPPGKWKIAVRDILSGLSRASGFVLHRQAPKP